MPWPGAFPDEVTPEIDFIDVPGVKILLYVLLIYKWSQVNFDLNTYGDPMYSF